MNGARELVRLLDRSPNARAAWERWARETYQRGIRHGRMEHELAHDEQRAALAAERERLDVAARRLGYRTLDEVIDAGPGERARRWLSAQLAEGERPAAELVAAARLDGVCSERTLREAKAALGVEQRWRGRTSVWYLRAT